VDRIPIGVIYKNNRPVLEEMSPVIAEKPLGKQGFGKSILKKTLKEFY